MAKKGRSSSYVELISSRKNGPNHLSVGINVAQLETLLCESIPMFSDDDDLIELAKERYQGLAARRRNDASSWATADELNEVVTILQHFLSSAPSLPTHLVFAVHSHLGCIRLLQQKYDNAIQSFLKALWILTSTNEQLLDQIALCLHRLGIAYGRNGKYGEAVNLLNKALLKYEASVLSKDHPCVTAARDDLAHFRDLLSRSRIWASLPPRHFAPLMASRIDEDLPTTRQRRVSH